MSEDKRADPPSFSSSVRRYTSEEISSAMEALLKAHPELFGEQLTVERTAKMSFDEREEHYRRVRLAFSEAGWAETLTQQAILVSHFRKLVRDKAGIPPDFEPT